MMSMAEMRTLAERHFYELLDAQNLTVVDDSYAADIIVRDPMGILVGRDRLREWAEQVHQAIPNHRFTVFYTLAEADHAVCRFSARGSFTQPYFNQQPTDRKFVMNGVALFRFAGSHIAEIEVVYDARVFKEELGVAPPVISGL
jgi:predicted ester cyclase